MPGTERLITIEEARHLVLERVVRLPAERIPLEAAHGRVLADDAVAAIDLPPFDSSAMDGFAVRSSETPGRLPVVHRIAAGAPAPCALEAGEAMGISTGAVVPAGADAVIPLEYVVETDNAIDIQHPVEPGANVRHSGGDSAAGATIVEAGTRLEARHLAALAAAGVPDVRVARRPRAAVVVTGSELRTPGEPLQPGQIYETNGILLEVQLRSAGAEVERAGAVVDEEAAHRDALAHGLGADVLVTSGGVSVGPHDLVRSIAAELGVDEVFWGVAVKPGKPISFGVAGRRLVFGLPGNPVSVLVGFELFVRPALLALQGALDPGPRFERGVLGSRLARSPARDELVRARVRRPSDGPVLEPLAGRDSHMIARASAADALVLIPRGNGELEAGEPVEFLPI